jgi:hypothetical protein
MTWLLLSKEEDRTQVNGGRLGIVESKACTIRSEAAEQTRYEIQMG